MECNAHLLIVKYKLVNNALTPSDGPRRRETDAGFSRWEIHFRIRHRRDYRHHTQPQRPPRRS